MNQSHEHSVEEFSKLTKNQLVELVIELYGYKAEYAQRICDLENAYCDLLENLNEHNN